MVIVEGRIEDSWSARPSFLVQTYSWTLSRALPSCEVDRMHYGGGRGVKKKTE